MSLEDFIFSIFITLLVYLLVPTIICFGEKRYSVPSLRKISILNGVGGFVFFVMLQLISGSEPSSNVWPAFFWSYIGYILMKKNRLQKDGSSNSENLKTESTEHFSLSDPHETFTRSPGAIYGDDIALVREEKPDRSTEDVDTTIPSEEVIIQDEVNPLESEAPVVVSENVSETPLRYCKNCGSVIDGISKKCTGCGKQYFKLDFKIITGCIAIILFICNLLLLSYVDTLKTKMDDILIGIDENSELYNSIDGGIITGEEFLAQKDSKYYAYWKKNHAKVDYFDNTLDAYSSIKYNIYPIYTPNTDGSTGYSSVKNSALEIISVGDDIVFISDNKEMDVHGNELKEYVTLEQLYKNELSMGAKFTYRAIYKQDAISQGYTAFKPY